MKKMSVSSEWVKENYEKTLFFVFFVLYIILLCVNGSELLTTLRGSVNYFPYSDSISNKKYYVDFDRVALLIDEVKNPQDLALYYKRDIFTEHKGEPVQVERIVKEDAVAKGEQFRLEKIFRQPVKLLFKGYMQLPGGVYSIQINWGRKTDFKKIGETIRGYEIRNFQQRFFNEELPSGVQIRVNKSIVEIKKGDGTSVTLERGKLITEKELFAKLFDRKKLKAITVHVGSVYDGHKVLDITEREVILSRPNGEKLHLKSVNSQ
ncbi:MAG: hypothetical protein P9M13_10085 [Candidatus Ancaeobacter aquaticus]|nr:hypothetical protein [Candidatus Ancaeobacter aquaticus]